MTAGSFQEDSFGWQAQQLRQRIGEWIELRLFGTPADYSDTPTVSLPDWLERGLFWLIVLLTLTWLIWQIQKILRPYWKNWRSQSWQTLRPMVSQPKRDPNLSEWLRRAQQAQKEGNYAEACRALYMAMLQRLHEKQLVPQQASRTDGEYLKLVQQMAAARPYQVLIQTHERLCFGNAVISPEVYHHCQQAYQEIERQ